MNIDFLDSTRNNEPVAIIETEKNLDPLTKKIKRSAAVLEDAGVNDYPKKKRCIEQSKNESVIEFLRDDAFFIGQQERNYRDLQLCKEMGIEMDVEEVKPKKIKKADRQIIEEITKKGSFLGLQLEELFYLLPTLHLNKKDQELILDFAVEILNQVPDQKNSNEMDCDEQYLKMANDFLINLPFAFTKDQTKELALKLQNEMNEERDDTSENEDLLEIAKTRMGCLMLVLEKNKNIALQCACTKNIDDSIRLIEKNATLIIAASRTSILKHAKSHQNTSIQDHKEALFHKMSLEMADLMLLETGSLNFGILDMLSTYLIPEEFQNLISIENVRRVMADLATNPAMWKEVASIMPPENEKTPSSFAIRATLGLELKETITKRHAQIYVLSAMLGHYRQANVGSCFATSFLIKALFYHPEFFIQDLKQLTEEGKITRVMNQEYRHFPYFNRVTKEFLDTLVEVDNDGYLFSSQFDTFKQKRIPESITLNNSYLFEAPGLIAACNAMGIEKIKETILPCLQILPRQFTIHTLLKMVAKEAFKIQESARYQFRSSEIFTEEEFLERGLFAFGIQTNHPLHRAYEQSAVSMVDYFGTEYQFPAWIHGTLTEVIDKAEKGLPLKLQAMFKTLKAEMFLPLIVRMRFRYNPHIDDAFKLFEDDIHEMDYSGYYGYELMDGGLPEDFVYSKELYNQYENHTSFHTILRFEKHLAETSWKLINTEEKFQAFLVSVIKETVKQLKINEKSETKKQWDEVLRVMCKAINVKNFGKQMTLRLLGKNSDQQKSWNKNPHNMQTTPWSFRWGGDFDAVMQSFFGFSRAPSKLIPFKGTPKEVLAKCINFVKKQPEQIKKDLCENASLLMVSSPVHAFLMKPDEETFVDAIDSDLSTNEYIQEKIEIPGHLIANSRLNIRGYKEIIDFIAKNQWIERQCEKPDFERIKLTNYSRQVFDDLIDADFELFSLTNEDFKTRLIEIVSDARASDERIGCRNAVWENQLAKKLDLLQKSLINTDELQEIVSNETANVMINFARNQEDSAALSDRAAAKFLRDATKIPHGLSIKDFRNAIVEVALEAHTADSIVKDKSWKNKLGTEIDNRLFEMLDENKKEQLLASAIITHDPNWKKGVHDYRLGFMINPGTGNLEFFRFLPDLKSVTFFDQKDWFPMGKGHGSWQFPDNYRSYATGPLFNVKKHM